jgi:dehydrogenase/reductase SDR family member 12
MAHYVGRVTTSRSPDEVFEYLADFSRVADWDPGVERAYPVNSGGVRRGARFKVIARFLGREVPLTYRTVELDRPNRVVVHADNGRVVSHDAITLQAAPGGGTVVTYDAELRLKGPLRIAELPMRLLFRRIGDRARAGLEEVLA